MMTIISPQKAAEYFENKLEFTTGPYELQHMIQNNEVKVIDVRAREDYANGHIPGAINLPRDQWSSLSGLSNEKINVVYCYGMVCHLAAQAAKLFAENGYAVMELEGGFDEWKNHGMETEK